MSDNETNSIDGSVEDNSGILDNESLEGMSDSEENPDKDSVSKDSIGVEDEWDKPSANSSAVSIVSGKIIDSLELFKILKFQNESTQENTSSEALVQTNNESSSGSSSGNQLGKKENDNTDLSSKEIDVDLVSVEETVDQGLVDTDKKSDNNAGKLAAIKKNDLEDDFSTEIGEKLRPHEQESEGDTESESENEIDIKTKILY